ncbi:MAG: FHA domain-containing protein [Deltaproteobacteria bacterium]|nr:MAG: FHA domain-containing protein [Deltaproteobacteria bacterium]
MDVGLVCDACDGFSEMGAKTCARCGAALSLRPATGAEAAGNAEGGGADATPCATCAAPVPAGHAFCSRCGSPAGGAAPSPATKPANAPRKAKTMFFGAMQQARAKLTLIKGDGLDGVSFTLAGQDHIAGRVDAPLLFDEDPYLSPTHANFFYKGSQLWVRDLDSANGVYVRIREPVEVGHGDRFLIGEQVLDIEVQPIEPEPTAKPDGTYFFASPRRSSRFRIVQRLRGGDTGLAYRAQSDVVSLGREGNDVNFPDDPFISGHHARVCYRDGRLYLEDLGSKNGTFLRVNGEQELRHGDYVFMGQQLLRVEIV